MAEKDATKENGASEKEKTQETSKHQDRRDAIEGVLEGRHKELEADGLHIEPGKELVPPEETERELEAEPAEEKPTEPEPTPEPETPDEEMVTIKVRGEEQQVPMSQVYEAGTRVLQKETDLEKRYDEVTKMQKELERKLAGLPSEKDKDLPTEDEEVDEEDYSELAYALQYGTSEEAEAAIRKLKGTDNLSKDTIRETVTQIQQEERQKNLINQMKQPADKGGFADLMDEGVLQSRFAAEVDILVNHEGMAYDSWDTYKKAGEAIRKRYSATTKVEVPVDKQERKQATDTVKGANIKDKSETETEKAPTSGEADASSVILDMKKTRGQI